MKDIQKTNKEVDWEEKILEYIYRHSPVAYFPNPIPPQTATQEMVLQEFYSYIRSLLLTTRNTALREGMEALMSVSIMKNDKHLGFLLQRDAALSAIEALISK